MRFTATRPRAPHDGHAALAKLLDELVFPCEHAARSVFLGCHGVGFGSGLQRAIISLMFSRTLLSGDVN